MINRTEEDIVRAWDSDAPVLATVCCIAYNQESYVGEAIDSFLSQETEFPFEIIVHDDASTDGTAEVILGYAKRYPRLIRTIIQTENQYSKGGLINPRFVFPKAAGKYLAICEGDDYWTDKTKLQKQVTFLENNPEYVITYTDCEPFDNDGVIDHDFGGAKKDLEALDLKKAAPLFTVTTCFRNVIDHIPKELVSARYGDLVIWSLLGHHGKGKYMADILPAAYRVHSGGLHSKKIDRERAKSHLLTVRALLAYYERVGDKKMARFFRISVFMSSMRSKGFGRLYRFARSLYRLPGRVAR
jgi:glycosyltransferase involved in cell wall biosynthesis